MTRDELLLVYDKECPVCNYYCLHVRIKNSIGELKLVDARESSEIMKQITTMGLDIDQGMVLKMGDALYYGSDAINMLALIGSSSGIFNKINYYIFRSKALSKLLYPILRSCRNLLLKVLGKTKINNLNVDENDYF